MTTYAEFRLRIERIDRQSRRSYRVEASGLGGEGEGRFKVPFTDTELENFILKVGRTRRGVRRLESPEMELAKAFGGRLFTSIMAGKVGELYRAAFTEARATGKGLRVTLSLTGVPELGAIPWEYLYDSTDFLSISTWTPVVRYLDLPKPRRPLEIQLPLRILAVISAPSNAEALDTAAERRKLEDALAPLTSAGALVVDWLERPSLLALSRKLRPDTYHVLHFIGHGGFDDTNGEGGLLFEDESGLGRPVSGDQLATIVRDKVNLRLVVLNSCEGARNSVKDPFSGVATSLVQREVPAVIGMQFEITDRAAVLFASEFYAVLAEGKPVDAAVTEARLAIFADHNDVEWATPVLFMRVADGRLFDVADASTLPRSDAVTLPVKPDLPVDAGSPVESVPTTEAVPTTETVPASETLPTSETGRKLETAKTIEPTVAAIGDPELAALVGDAARPTPADVPPSTTATEPVAPTPVQPLPRAADDVDPVWRRLTPRSAVVVAALVVLVVAVAAFALWPRTPGAIGTGSLDVNDRGALVTGRIIATGFDFEPGETVDLYIDSQPVADVVVSPDGRFSVEIDLGGRTQGTVHAEGRSSGNEANTSFDLAAPGASAGPTEGAVDPTAQPLGGGTSPGILFYSNTEGEDNELYLLDPTSNVVTTLTMNSRGDSFPTWSPDYRQIAYSRGSTGNRRIYVRDLEGDETGVPVSAGDGDEYFPAWSQGGWIAFVRADSPESSGIWVVRSDGSGLREVISGRTVRAPAWSPDGTRIAFFGNLDDDSWDLYTVRADGTDLDRLTSAAAYDRNPSWSPDGKTIVFVRGDNTNDRDVAEIHVLDLETRIVGAALTDNEVQDGNPVFSPDGSLIAFYRDSGPGYHLWLMNRDGSDERDVMEDRDGSNLDPIWR